MSGDSCVQTPEQIRARDSRRQALIEEWGMPEHILAPQVMKLAGELGVPMALPLDTYLVYASIYRDSAAADAWFASNLKYNGHPEYARFSLADGRVVGLLDLRPAYAAALAEAKREAGK